MHARCNAVASIAGAEKRQEQQAGNNPRTLQAAASKGEAERHQKYGSVKRKSIKPAPRGQSSIDDALVGTETKPSTLEFVEAAYRHASKSSEEYAAKAAPGPQPPPSHPAHVGLHVTEQPAAEKTATLTTRPVEWSI